MSKTLLLFLCPMLVAGCVAPATTNWSMSQESQRTVSVERDDFKKVTRFVGANCASTPDAVFLRAWKRDGVVPINYQIYVKDYYRGAWRFYESAYDSEGNPLDVTLISRDVVSCRGHNCSFEEHLGISVSREYLEAHKGAGIQFKVYGTAGQETFVLSRDNIIDFLERIDSTRSSKTGLPDRAKVSDKHGPSPEFITAVGKAYVPDSYVGTPMARQVTIDAATNDAKQKLLHRVRTLRLSNGARLIEAVDINKWAKIEQTVLRDSNTAKTEYFSDGSIEVTLSIPMSSIEKIMKSQ